MNNSIVMRGYRPRGIWTRGFVELAYCTAAYFILLNIFVGADEAEMIDHIYTSIFLGNLIIAGTVNSWVIRKRLLFPGKFWMFLGLSLLNIAFWTFFNQVLFGSLIDYVLPGYYFISYYEYTDLFKFFVAYVTTLTLLDLSWEWFQLQETRHRMLAIEKDRINAELKALTNQVNPHFLFNSLTVLYSLSLRNSTETSGAILKLSDILRYVIYESSRGEVPLRSEIDLIRSYIDLQRYRVPADTRIDFAVDVDNESMPIQPMLLMPLVENSFKHGVKGDISDTFVDIRLESGDGAIFFNIRNNKPAINGAGTEGVGLKNIEERLKLTYPNRYTLRIDDRPDEFEVSLHLK